MQKLKLTCVFLEPTFFFDINAYKTECSAIQ